jgi:hypothetical protein
MLCLQSVFFYQPSFGSLCYIYVTTYNDTTINHVLIPQLIGIWELRWLRQRLNAVTSVIRSCPCLEALGDFHSRESVLPILLMMFLWLQRELGRKLLLVNLSCSPTLSKLTKLTKLSPFLLRLCRPRTSNPLSGSIIIVDASSPVPFADDDDDCRPVWFPRLSYLSSFQCTSLDERENPPMPTRLDNSHSSDILSQLCLWSAFLNKPFVLALWRQVWCQHPMTPLSCPYRTQIQLMCLQSTPE